MLFVTVSAIGILHAYVSYYMSTISKYEQKPIVLEGMHTSVNRRHLQQIIGIDWDGKDGKFYVENMAKNQPPLIVSL